MSATLEESIRAALGPAGQPNTAETRAEIRKNLEAFMSMLPRLPAPQSKVECVSTPEQLEAGEMVFRLSMDRETYQAMDRAASRSGLTMYLHGEEGSDDPPNLVITSPRTYYTGKPGA